MKKSSRDITASSLAAHSIPLILSVLLLLLFLVTCTNSCSSRFLPPNIGLQITVFLSLQITTDIRLVQRQEILQNRAKTQL